MSGTLITNNNEWQQMTTSGTMNANERQRMATSGTTNDKEWQ